MKLFKSLSVDVLLLAAQPQSSQLFAQQPAASSASAASGEAEAPMPPADTVQTEPAAGNLLPGDKAKKYDTNSPVFRDVAKEFRCPTCTGLSVLESDAGFSVQIKEQVQEQINLGKNREQIVDFFVERYGPWILREPPVKGFNAWAWIVPITLLCLGPVLIWLLVWKRRVQADSHGVRSSTVILEEMQQNLQRLKREAR